MHPKDLSILDFTYHLPDDKIAFRPLENRHDAKLLVYKKGEITTDIYRNIPTHLPQETLLVFNDTKVIEARLLFQKPTGGVIEIFCLEPDDTYSDITTALQQEKEVNWQCMVGGASKWKSGQVLEKEILVNGERIFLQADCVEKAASHFLIKFTWNASITFAELLHHAGAIPLPPYIKRLADEEDVNRYQTVYAHHDGSVAAPTAGLHFTQEVLNDVTSKNIKQAYVTLHVGAGTFKPVKASVMQEHDMHSEFISVPKQTIESLLQKINDPIVAVGTTSLRTIESLYWLGVKIEEAKIKNQKPPTVLTLTQWEGYEIESNRLSNKEALQSLLTWMKENSISELQAKTQIIIAPGYTPKIASGLITNFHQPQSTLLLLVAALIGEDWRKVYSYALQNNFRFLSYGDGSLLWFQSH